MKRERERESILETFLVSLDRSEQKVTQKLPI